NHKVTLPDPNQELLVLMTEGAVYGFYSRFIRLPRNDYFIALLTNVRSSRNYLPEIGEAIVRILYNRPFAPPRRSIAPVLRYTIVQSGVQAALDEYRALKAHAPEQYDFGEMELNSLGYYLLTQMQRPGDAIAVFRLNVEAYPRSWNTHDSLGEAYAAAGDR